MAVDPKKRQKKLERRAVQRKTKQLALMREKSGGWPSRLAGAARMPIVDCLATESLWKNGLGWILLSRQMPTSGIAYAVFLVDRYCLGVKNVKVGCTNRFSYDESVLHELRQESKTISPANARRFVESAVEYARSLGFPPHPLYQRASILFGDVDTVSATEVLEFGKDGKPLFFAGPNDNQARCRQIMATLERKCGRDGFEFIMPMPSGPPLSPDENVDGMIEADEMDELEA